jgi:hypothetical protein
LICLDDWGARLAAIEGLRQWTSERPAARCSTIQVGVNRDPDQRFGAASVACFGSRWNDPCPACGMTCLPEPEPCVVFDDLGRPVRGNLWREAHAAGRLAARMVCDWLSGATNWTNTKSLVHAANPGARRTDLLTYRVSRYAGCLGPHRPSVRWDSMLLNALGIEQGGNDVR